MTNQGQEIRQAALEQDPAEFIRPNIAAPLAREAALVEAWAGRYYSSVNGRAAR